MDNAQSGQAKGIQKPISGEPSDTVQLSSDQATVRQLVSQIGQVPDVRHGQVNTLRSAIASGKYNPSNEQVAGSLADQLFGAQRAGHNASRSIRPVAEISQLLASNPMSDPSHGPAGPASPKAACKELNPRTKQRRASSPQSRRAGRGRQTLSGRNGLTREP